MWTVGCQGNNNDNNKKEKKKEEKKTTPAGIHRTEKKIQLKK